MVDQAPIFVVGPPRSGTTLTGKIIGQHPEVLTLGETHFFEDVWTRREQIGSLDKPSAWKEASQRVLTLYQRYNFPDAQRFVETAVSPDKLRTHMPQGGGYGDLYQTFTQLVAESAYKKRFCDDTPKHLFYLETIFDLFPNAKVVACVRDPRDYLTSYKNYWRRSTESERVKALYHPVVTSILWRSIGSVLASLPQKYTPEQVCLIQYEKLVQSPEETVEKLCTFLNVAYAPEMLEVQTHNSSFYTQSVGIFTGSIGRWQTELEPEELWWVQTIAGRQMRALGYETAVAYPQKTHLLRQLVSAPFALRQALNANSAKRGPLLGYLWRRLKVLR